MKSKHLLATAVAATLVGTASATPFPHGPVAATDVGPAASFAENAQVTVTVALSLRNPEQMEQLIESVYTAGSPQYHKFLSPGQFQAQFGPSAATVAAVSRHFEAQGLTVSRTSTAHLHVTGTAAQIEKAFAVQLHSFAVAPKDDSPGYRYRAPLGAPQIPAAIAASVRGVLGLDTKPRYRPHLHDSLKAPRHPQASTNTTDPPGFWTVQDYAEYYDVTPLYNQGLTGKGTTIGIVTLAAFTPSDAFLYWDGLGLKTDPNRITIENVDGGPGAPSDRSGSDETTLDVQQSGGLSPGAKIIVYQAPNTNQGFVDCFAHAIDENRADTVSTSWGEWEGFDGPDPVVGNGPVTDPITGQQTTTLKAFDDLFAQGALQGQSWFAASGDSGGYDTFDELPSNFGLTVSVDSPSSQRFITAAGGTTLPGVQDYAVPSGTLSINVPQERAWSWDYLQPLCNALGTPDPTACGIFSAGDGGGVSIYVLRPFYQLFTPGMANTVPGQTITQLTPPPAQTLFVLPSGFPGRNTPDLSTNADPQTGFEFPYTSSRTHEVEELFGGGTSFVAPDLNGVTSLFVQGLHHRVGLLNPALYFIAATDRSNGRNAPLRDIKSGDNWFWQARPGFDQATGLGAWDVANMLEALRRLEP